MTSGSPIYWIDSNVLISAKDGPFRFHVAPGFWMALLRHAKAGNVRVSKMVYDEIVRDGPQDDLARWLKENKNAGFCVLPSGNVQKAYTRVADHVATTYKNYRAAVFLSVADAWVIAHALECGGVVVTFETRQIGSQKVKIPNVCDHFHVPVMNLWDMNQALGVRFD